MVEITMLEISAFISSAITCSYITSYLIRKKEMPAVRASSLVTLIATNFVMMFDMKSGNRIAPVILGSTFVGMSEPHRLGYRSLTIASIVFALIFYFIVPFNPGFGGALGLAAFCSCILIYGMKTILKKNAPK